LYQVGSFIGHRWAEWNGQYRDDVRQFVKGDSGTIKKLAARLTASPDLYPQPDREPNRTINFVTCHDGFTLADLVAYNVKHNAANHQYDHDGSDTNFSWNCGVEGPTADAAVNALRERQMKNLLTILLLSQGTPMIPMGDEIRRTQHGNNNAYCQDNETSWFNWADVERHADFLRFVRELIAFTQRRDIFQQEHFWSRSSDPTAPERCLTWHGLHLGQPDWTPDSHSLAFTLHDHDSSEYLHIMLNAYWQPLTFDLPPLPPGLAWQRVIDTSLPAPDDFTVATEPLNTQANYCVAARTVALLKSCAQSKPDTLA
jgi:glycogen operon protein